MKNIITILFFFVNTIAFSQKNNISDVKKARKQIVALKENGALVIRLHLSKKKINLYRKAGKTKLADKLQEELDNNNYFIALAFQDSTFTFCPVYVIDTKDYGRIINGEKSGFFLNENMEVDSSIVMEEDYFLFVERGDVYEQVGDGNFKNSVTSSSIVITDAFVIKDENMNQLIKPFPFFRRITAYSNLGSNLGFYSISLKKWVFNYNFIEKTDERYERNKAIISKRLRNMSKEEIHKDSKNISAYYKNIYKIEKKDLNIPYSIYKFNVKLMTYYLKMKNEK